MPELAEEIIARNLAAAARRLQDDLEQLELWTAALGSFQRPAPHYKPDDRFLLPAVKRACE